MGRRKQTERSVCIHGDLYWELDAFVKKHGGSKKAHTETALRRYMDAFEGTDTPVEEVAPARAPAARVATDTEPKPTSLLDIVAADEEAERWNIRHGVGTRIEYNNGRISWVTTPAEVVDGVACLSVRGVARKVPLREIQVIADNLVRKPAEEVTPPPDKPIDGSGVREF